MAGDGPQNKIDALLAAVLRRETPAWPTDGEPALAVERILYHGIAGLIIERARDLPAWPSEVMAPVHDQAIAQAMWEMRHKPLLAGLLAALADAGVVALLLKGSALAYDLYPEPSARSRGDSDILIAPDDLAETRRLLGQLGFKLAENDVAGDDLALQEVWIAPGAMPHHIDLHWQLLNAPALAGVMAFDDCAADPLALPRLGPRAMAMNRVATLLHTCVHRAMHITTPYFVDGVTYHGGDRLIWANDIALLASALSEAEWAGFVSTTLGQGVAAVALDGLDIANRRLGAQIPPEVRQCLGEAKREAASDYLLRSGQAGRSWSDLRSIPGFRGKIAYATGRTLPSASFMRSKYPDMVARPLVALYARRVIELLRPRPSRR